ncbi:MAG: prepilin-type N-terminal cleavage/methylation domain-containing protein [Methyloprofundus sp.]|nr:prepilin-type N-terminal cleavage/methylation domain-containing protein [Methyloprofundus sp.]
MIGKSSHQQGFSLLEILIAFSILALSLGILLNIFSGGLRRTIVSEEYQQAVIIAQSKLAAAGVESELEDADGQGKIQEKYAWSVRAQPLDIEKIGLDDEKTRLSPYQVTVRVEWSAGKNDRQVELTTIKLSKKQ